MENSSENGDGTGLVAVQTELAIAALWTHFPKSAVSCLLSLGDGFNPSPSFCRLFGQYTTCKRFYLYRTLPSFHISADNPDQSDLCSLLWVEMNNLYFLYSTDWDSSQSNFKSRFILPTC